MDPLRHPLFIKFIAYFNENQDYFECHEVLEDYWNLVAPRDRAHPLVGYIQSAVALYHWRRGNFRGAAKLFPKAERLLRLTFEDGSPFSDGVDLPAFLRNIRKAADAVEDGLPFVAFPIRVTDSAIRDAVSELVQNGAIPDLTGARLIHKHMLRDRGHILSGNEKRRSSRH
ncbi:DUF309 domain-containing protein [Bhargavaea beijingensis]|uniref:DUF309 domain-containing protein n=1 Tax=Bhargavaea beijingensis TaxID=426756 RepID=UPI000A7BEA7A|nr:DUF309 domain-containing protein [Bhargavaea beijingensis]MCW1928229.1 DUF309 domain-containing protein [Bhargavaea beijingensis]